MLASSEPDTATTRWGWASLASNEDLLQWATDAQGNFVDAQVEAYGWTYQVPR